ncbi:virulence RhuM family protein, partial [Candidatus Saccharibacteria bacterium]|nr:virulence RhuM family protein [Candidatus Saccharibacteria bacterium]
MSAGHQPENRSQIEIYQGLQGEVIFNVDPSGDTIWATRSQIAQVFGVTPRNITDHLRNIYETGELDEKRTRKKNFIVRTEGNRTVRREVDLYNLDMIISVGYRVNSKKATNFRIWATKVLKQYVTR